MNNAKISRFGNIAVIPKSIKLNDQIENLFRLNAWQKKGLAKLKIRAVGDLLRYFPFRYERPAEMKNINEIMPGDAVYLKGRISDIKSRSAKHRKINLIEAKFSDQSGIINIIWFNLPYIAKILNEGEVLVLNGKVSQNKKGLYLANPIFQRQRENKHSWFGPAEAIQPVDPYNNSLVPAIEPQGFALAPIYGTTKGISSKWLHLTISKVLKTIDHAELTDFFPEHILKKYHLPNFRQAIGYIHNPRDLKNTEAAKKRFAFEEIFLIQLARMKERLLRRTKPRFKISVDYKNLKTFVASLPFQLTNAQRKAIFRITEDFKKNEPMGRLLEGDVGSGKTIVALTASKIAADNGWQVAYMAPTEILARQHFNTFINYLSPCAKIGLITSSLCEKFPSKVNPRLATHISKNQLLKWVKAGEIKILIGTHSLIQNKVAFKNLALTIVDEQHRFGIHQRLKIIRKNNEKIPHLLSMTATPIPRTLALTIYGDLDLTLLDEMPPARKRVMTYIVPPDQRARAYEQIREEIKNGKQAYVVCPRIESQDDNSALLRTSDIQNYGCRTSVIMKAVKEEYEKLSKEIFPEYKLAILHGKILPKEKEKIMTDFRKGKIDILVTTSVIEVGIDVPNANCILIEGADRFGLAQLHQLRGRVLRSEHQAFCFILSESSSVKTLKRLAALRQAKNGFELAEYDLKLRGPGELSGTKQWGISDLGMEALKNIKMVEAARIEAAELLKEDAELQKFPFLKQALINYENILHWE